MRCLLRSGLVRAGVVVGLAMVVAEVQAAPAKSPAPLPVFANGTEGYACFRIPVIVRTPSGTLLAFAEARRHSCNDFGDVRIVMRSSRDEGKSWGALTTVAENGALQAGNPAPVVDTADPRYRHGRIVMVYCTGDASEDAVMRGEGTRRVWLRTSVDEGATWDAAVEITASVKLPAWRHYATGPGHVLQLRQGPHAGRIVVSGNHSEGDPQPAGHAYAAHAFYSDDHGATWHLSESVAWPGSNESTAAETADGTVVMNSRDQSRSSGGRVVSLSHDGGVRWDKVFAAPDLPDPVCEGSMIDYRRGRLLVFSNAGNRSERRDLTISVSSDGGLTWPKHTVIFAGPAAYSDIVAMKASQLGVLWERGNSGGIFFAALPVAPLVK